MLHVFVGDIHGKEERVREALDKDGRIVFVGDIMDSYSRKGVTNIHGRHAQARCLDLICDAVEKGKAEACWGNHELSYLRPSIHHCGGYTSKKAFMFKEREKRLRACFKPYIFLNDKFLVSHAGLVNDIYKGFYMDTLDRAAMEKMLNRWWEDPGSPMHWIGQTRGGRAPIGGMFWCDFNFEHEPVEGLTQVFGHTRGRGIRQRGSSYCIDTLDWPDEQPRFLELDVDVKR